MLATAALALSAAMLLGACGGSVAGGTLSSAPPPESVPAASASTACMRGARAVCITASANGQTVVVGVGWRVGVDLQGSERAWSAPVEGGADLLRQVAGVRRDGGAVQVAYTAVAPGRTDLRATERPLCRPGRMCPQFILLWQVHIQVSGR
jgi:hypothetical protein